MLNLLIVVVFELNIPIYLCGFDGWSWWCSTKHDRRTTGDIVVGTRVMQSDLGKAVGHG